MVRVGHRMGRPDPGRASKGTQMVIKRVNPMSAAKVGGVVGVMLGLLIGACISLFMLAFGGAMAAASDEPRGAFVGIFFGVGAIVVVPIFYGVLTFIMGALYAAVCNLAAKWTGGLEIEAA
jgi:hypothetical protein